MNYSQNIDLLEPEQNEQYNIDHFNTNFEKIDEHIHNLEENSDTLGNEIRRVDEETRQFENMNGICQIAQGGTGKVTAQEALDELHKEVQIADSVRDVDNILLMQSVSGVETVKKILVEDLAAKVFDIIRESSGIFTAEKNGFAPRSGGHGTADFLRADGTWDVPPGIGTSSVDITSSSTYGIDNDVIFRIKDDTTTVVSDPSKLMVKATFINETAKAQRIRLRLKEGNAVYRLNRGKTWQMAWNGSFWIPLYEEEEPGTLKATFATTAPDGWFMCVGTDTTGTEIQLSTCYPNLYDILGSNVIPDLRECGIVGAGRNALLSILTHDVYEVGQFKDDIVRDHTHSLSNHTHSLSNHVHGLGGHTHDRGTMEIEGHFHGTAGERALLDWGTGAFSVSEHVDSRIKGMQYVSTNMFNQADFYASRSWTGRTGAPNTASDGPSNNTSGTPSNNTSGAVDGSGKGASTHGKLVGANIMIKA